MNLKGRRRPGRRLHQLPEKDDFSSMDKKVAGCSQKFTQRSRKKATRLLGLGVSSASFTNKETDEEMV